VETNLKETEAELGVLRANLTIAERDLAFLESADLSASMTDNHYAISGRMGAASARIAAKRRQIEDLKARIKALNWTFDEAKKN